MAFVLSTVVLRNHQFAARCRNAANQNQTITYTFTAATTADLGQGIIGTLQATTASTFLPAEVMPTTGTDGRNLIPDTVSN